MTGQMMDVMDDDGMYDNDVMNDDVKGHDDV
jgi:hypothetical protein